VVHIETKVIQSDLMKVGSSRLKSSCSLTASPLGRALARSLPSNLYIEDMGDEARTSNDHLEGGKEQ
jgi:hypothetical protein